MCGCENNIITDEQRFGVPEGTPCSEITVGLLEMYKNPIGCYLRYGLHSQIGVSVEDLQAAYDFLDQFITQKTNDPNDCTGIDNLVTVRVIFSLILKRGICL